MSPRPPAEATGIVLSAAALLACGQEGSRLNLTPLRKPSPQKSVRRDKPAGLQWGDERPTREVTLHPEPPQGVHRWLKRGMREVLGADLSGYFDTIPHPQLMRSLSRSSLESRETRLSGLRANLETEQLLLPPRQLSTLPDLA